MQNLNRVYLIMILSIGIALVASHDVFATDIYDQNNNQNTANTQQISNTSNSNSITVYDSTFSVQYSINNGQVISIHGNNQSRSVIVQTKTTGDGTLIITLPRGLIDSKINGKDDGFFVSIDGQEESFDEIKTTDTDRTLSIPFSTGVKEIEIIGTKAVPEFGIITSLTLLISVTSVILLVTRTRKIAS